MGSQKNLFTEIYQPEKKGERFYKNTAQEALRANVLGQLGHLERGWGARLRYSKAGMAIESRLRGRGGKENKLNAESQLLQKKGGLILKEVINDLGVSSDVDKRIKNRSSGEDIVNFVESKIAELDQDDPATHDIEKKFDQYKEILLQDTRKAAEFRSHAKSANASESLKAARTAGLETQTRTRERDTESIRANDEKKRADDAEGREQDLKKERDKLKAALLDADKALESAGTGVTSARTTIAALLNPTTP